MTFYKFDLHTGQYLGPVLVGNDPPITAAGLGPGFVAEAPPGEYKNPAWNKEAGAWVDRPDQGIRLPAQYNAPLPTTDERLYALESAMMDVGAMLGNMLGGGT